MTKRGRDLSWLWKRPNLQGTRRVLVHRSDAPYHALDTSWMSLMVPALRRQLYAKPSAFMMSKWQEKDSGIIFKLKRTL